MDLEGSEVCDWLTSKGITCVRLSIVCRANTSLPGTSSGVCLRQLMPDNGSCRPDFGVALYRTHAGYTAKSRSSTDQTLRSGVPGGIRTHVIRSHSPAFHR